MSTYTEIMWKNYVAKVMELHEKGYMPFEIARLIESDEILVKAIIEKFIK